MHDAAHEATHQAIAAVWRIESAKIVAVVAPQKTALPNVSRQCAATVRVRPAAAMASVGLV